MSACNECGSTRRHIQGCSKAGLTRGKDRNKDNPRNLELNPKARKEGYEIVTCPTCNGSGKRGRRPCQLCGGHGKIRALKS